MKQSRSSSNLSHSSSDDHGSVEAVLYRELFRFLSPHDTGGDARLGGRGTMATATDLPKPLARSLVHFYELLKSQTLAEMTDDLADQIAASIGHWFAQLWRQLLENVTGDDDEAQGSADHDDAEALIADLRRRWPEGNAEWTRGMRALETATDRGVYRSLIARLLSHQESLRIARRDLRLERALRLVTAPLADHLNDNVPVVVKIEEKLNRIFRRPGRWNIFQNAWQEILWDEFERLVPFVEEDDDLSTLAHRLVRGIDPLGERKVWRKRLESRISTVEMENGYGDAVGLSRTPFIQLAIPSERALLGHPETEDLFFHYLAEGGVVSLDMERIHPLRVHETVPRWDYITAPQRLGPVILCVDTSGSMQGEVVTIAGTAVLSFVREALRYGRPIDVIAVHNSLHVASFLADPESRTDDPPEGMSEGHDFPAGEPVRIDPEPIAALREIIAPAGMAGADVSPALDEALRRVERRSDQEGDTTDIVVISDIHFPKVGPDHLNRMYRLQSRGWVRVHALTIGRDPIEDPLNVFDYRWHYNTAEELDFRRAGRSRRIGITGAGV